MPDQEVRKIHVKDLVLWTENPRDPIDLRATDQDIVNRALEDTHSKWALQNLASSMGPYYDFSELPTVVPKDSKYIVYDGNRRVILAKIKLGLVSIGNNKLTSIPDCPEIIPCNVCSENIALKNVYRKHADTGSWNPLERDIFLNKFMHEPKSAFLLIEEKTGLISSNPTLNQRFVKEEIFNETGIKKLGLEIQEENLYSKLKNDELHVVLNDIVGKINDKIISTRKNRGKITEILDNRSREIIKKNEKNTPCPIKTTRKDFSDFDDKEVKQSVHKTPKTKFKGFVIFGGNLSLKKGKVNDLYRDICTLYEYYNSDNASFSDSFVVIIRMALRLLVETASGELRSKAMADYIKKYFSDARKNLSQNYQTFLSNNNISEKTLLQLLQTGAHNYEESKSLDKAIGISYIVGAMLSISHGK
jgi:hypothetical protein